MTVVLLTPNALAPLFRRGGTAPQDETSQQQARFAGLGADPRAFLVASSIAGVAPLFGFIAIALGLVGYVTALFKLSAIFTVLWAWLFLKRKSFHTRLLGVAIMVLGGALVAT